MRRLIATIVLTGAVAWSGTASPQRMNGERIANQCTVEGAFGQRFGEPIVGSRDAGGDAQFIDLPASFAPFTRAEVSVIRSSRRVHTISGVAQFNNHSAARTAFEAAVTALHADPRFAASMDGGVREGVTFYTGDPNELTALAAEIWIEDRQIVYSCMDGALFQRAFDERMRWR